MQTNSPSDNLLLAVLWVVVGSGLILLNVGGWLQRRIYPLFCLVLPPEPLCMVSQRNRINVPEERESFPVLQTGIRPDTNYLELCAEDTNASVDSLLSALMLLEDGDIERARTFLNHASQQIQSAALLLDQYSGKGEPVGSPPLRSQPIELHPLFGRKGGEATNMNPSDTGLEAEFIESSEWMPL